MAFIHNMQYHLTHISIFQDGMITAGDWSTSRIQRKGAFGLGGHAAPPEVRRSAFRSASFKAAGEVLDRTRRIHQKVADEIDRSNAGRRRRMLPRRLASFRSVGRESKRLEEAYLAIQHNRRWRTGRRPQGRCHTTCAL
jgi:hypothetical protein